MTLTAWDIYWVTRLDEISAALVIVGFGCFAGLMVGLILMTYPDHDRCFKPGKKICVTSLFVGCIGLGVNTLIPSTKQAAAMIVLPAIVNSEAAQFKTTLEQRYFWMGVCDAQVEKNNREDESE